MTNQELEDKIVSLELMVYKQSQQITNLNEHVSALGQQQDYLIHTLFQGTSRTQLNMSLIFTIIDQIREVTGCKTELGELLRAIDFYLYPEAHI